MFNSPTGHTHISGDEPPPDHSRRRAPKRRRRLRGLFALASAVGVGAAMLIAAQPAQAVTAIDGQWTVVHGGTGEISLNADGTYTSTCVAFPNYDDAYCPSPSGTFLYSTMSTASVTFYGSDGSTHSYRVSGLVSSPDTITSVFGSRTYSPLVMKPGTEFVCTEWSGTGTSFTRWGISPEVEYDASTNLLYATGSHDLIGLKNIDTQVDLIETAPNYFDVGYSCPLPPALPVMGVTSILDSSILSPNPSVWIPKAIVTIEDADGAAVSGASVAGSFLDAGIWGDCVTGVDGSCTVGGQYGVSTLLASSRFTTDSVTKDGMTWDGQHVEIVVYVPTTSVPTTTTATSTSTSATTSTPTSTSTPVPTTTAAPAPTVLHIGDLDDATPLPSGGSWQPTVTATVLDSTGAAVAGVTVFGTFSQLSGALSCITAADGTCTLTASPFKNSMKTTDFQTVGLLSGSATYSASANSDPDGDSNGTTITVTRP